MSMSSVQLTNISTCNDKQLSRLKSVLQGKTYMDLQVICYPIGGSFNVDVTSLHDVSEEELNGMVNMLMADYIMNGGK